MNSWILFSAGAGLGALVLGLEVLQIAGVEAADVLGGILTALVLLLVTQVIGLRNQAAGLHAKLERAIKDIEMLNRLLGDVRDQGTLLARTNAIDILRLREARLEYETRLNSTVEELRATVARLGSHR